MGNKHSLQTFVHRTLVYRLIAVAVALVILIGLAALFIEQDRVSRTAIDVAVGRLSIFSNSYDHLLADPNNVDREKVHQAVIEFRSNLHRGGTSSLIKITPEERSTAVRAARIMGLNVAGVDLLRSNRGPVVMEVNSSPGLEGIEGSTGKDVASLIIANLEKLQPGKTRTRGKG